MTHRKLLDLLGECDRELRIARRIGDWEDIDTLLEFRLMITEASPTPDTLGCKPVPEEN